MTDQTYNPYWPPNQAAPPPEKKGLGITSMVVGIVAIVLAFIPIVGVVSFLLGIAAVVLGILALVKKNGKGQGIAGLITGGLSLIIAGIVTAVTGAFIGAVDEGLQEATDDVKAAEDTEDEILEAAEEDDAVDDEAAEEEIEEAVDEDAEEAPAESDGEWVEVATLSGNGDQRGDVFTIENDARISYEFNADTSLDDDIAEFDDEFTEDVGEFGDSLAVGAIYLVAEGDNLADQGGLPELMIDGDDSGETMLYQTGSYYLDVTAANYESWTVTIEEQQ